MARLIPIVLKLEGGEKFDAEVDKREAKLRGLASLTVKQAQQAMTGGAVGRTSGVDNQLADMERALAGAKQISRETIQTAQAEKAVEAAKRASIATQREQIALERERLRLQKEIDAAQKSKPTITSAGAEQSRPNFIDYRAAAAAEKQLTSAVEREAKAQAGARQVAAAKAFIEAEKLQKAQSEIAKTEAAKRSRADIAAWNAMLASEKKVEAETLHINAVLAESAKVLANHKIAEAKRANADEIRAIKETAAAAKANSGGSGGKGFLTTASEIGNVISGIRNGISIVEGFASSVISTGESFVNLVKGASDYGREIESAEKKTGLTAQTLSSLRYAANLSGKEFSDLKSPLSNFAKELGAAAKGSESAQIKLRALGVTDFKDLDGSLAKVFARIESLPPGVKRMTAAAAAFGDEGDNMISVIDKMNGNVDDFTKNAEKMGVIMSEKDVQAAKEFGETYDRLSAQGIALGSTFLLQLAPDIDEAMTDISGSLAKNKDAAADYGKAYSAMFRGILGDAKDLYNFLDKRSDKIFGVADVLSGGILGTVDKGFDFIADRYAGKAKANGSLNTASNYVEETKAQKQARFAAENADTGTVVGKMPDYLDRELTSGDKLAILKKNNDLALSINQQAFQIAEARLKSHLTFTTEQQMAAAAAQSNLQKNSLGGQIAIQTKFFNDELGTAIKGSKEYQEISAEKVKTLGKLNNDLRLNEINTQTDILKFEQQISEQRRQAAITTGSLINREWEQFTDRQVFEFERGIAQQTVSAGEGYDRILQLTKQNFDAVLQNTREQNRLQLADQSLTKEQVINLKKEQFLNEQKLTEDNRRKILEIEERQYQAQIAQLTNHSQRVQVILSASAQQLGGAAGFFTPENVNGKSLENFQNIILNRGIQKQADEAFKAYQDTKNSPDSLQDHTLMRLKEYSAIEQANQSLKKEFDNLEPSVRAAYLEIEKLGIALTTTAGSYQNIDKIAQVGLFAKQQIELKAYNNELQLTSDLLALAKQKYANGLAKNINEIKANINAYPNPQGTPEISYVQGLNSDLKRAEEALEAFQKSGATTSEEILKLDNTLGILKLGLKDLGVKQAQEEADRYRNSIEGLTERLAKLHAGDVGETAGVRDSARKSILQDQNRQADEVIYLQEKLAHAGEDAADRYKIAWLKATYEVRDAQTQANESIIALQVQLSQKGVFSQNQSDAKVLEHLNQNIKGVTESVTDFRISIADSFLDEINAPFDALSRKLEHLPPMIQGIAKSFINLANDIVRAFSQKMIMRLLGLDGGGGANSIAGNNSGGGIGSILGGLLGGGQSSGSSNGGLFSGSQGGGIFNLGGSTSLPNSGGGTSYGGLNMLGGNAPAFNPYGGTSIGRNGQTIPRSGGGGIGLAGGIALGGTAANIIGGLVGGRAGGFISNIGTGAALGAQIGSIIPGIGTLIGAGVGAAIGGLVSLLGGDKNRKQDKKENIPALQKGFTDTLAQLRDLGANKNSILQDPDGVIGKATELRGQIASGFGINFLSSKYRKEAQTQIAAKLIEADSIIANIKEFAKKAYSAKGLEGQIVGEFANGNYFGGRDDQMKDMRRSLDMRRGYINGGQLGVDRHLGLFADGEIIANKEHQQNIIRAAGFDVFAHAGIPNYPTSSAQPLRGYADGNYFAPSASSAPSVSTAGAPQIVIKDERPINVNVYVEKDDFRDWKAHAESDSGQKVTAKVMEKKFENGELNLKKK